MSHILTDKARLPSHGWFLGLDTTAEGAESEAPVQLAQSQGRYTL